jgi:hypothetical protein
LRLVSGKVYYIIAASERGGYKGKRDVQTLITEVGAMFAGGELSEDDKDKVLRTINELYWIAKDKNKKHEPNKKEKE